MLFRSDRTASVELEQLGSGVTCSHAVDCGGVAVQQVAEDATGVGDAGDDAFGVGGDGGSVHVNLLEGEVM